MSAIKPTAEHAEMGRVLTDALVENLQDTWEVRRGLRKPEELRHVLLSGALVDTGATTLALPTRYILELGLEKTRERNAVSAHGKGTINTYEPVRLTLLGRVCMVEVMEVPNDVPPLIGQVPLEMLDLVVDPQGRRLMGNPAHGGVETLELY
jgi:predicted aspartyl protease